MKLRVAKKVLKNVDDCCYKQNTITAAKRVVRGWLKTKEKIKKPRKSNKKVDVFQMRKEAITEIAKKVKKVVKKKPVTKKK